MVYLIGLISLSTNIDIFSWECRKLNYFIILDLGYRLDYFEKYYYNLKCNVVAVAYRGYDESTGSPNQIGIQKDAIAIVRHVFTSLEIDKDNVFIHGRSLGGAVAIYAANFF